MWKLQVKFRADWRDFAPGVEFANKGDAEWAVASWKAANNCTGDPFRAVAIEVEDEADVVSLVPAHDEERYSEPVTDELPTEEVVRRACEMVAGH